MKKRVVAALLAVPFLGMVTAFGIAPDTAVETVETRTVTTEVALPAEVPAPLAETPQREAGYVYLDNVRLGDTIARVLDRMQVDSEELLDFLHKDERAEAVYRLPVGRAVKVETDAQGVVQSLFARVDTEIAVLVTRGVNGFYSRLVPSGLERRIEVRSGVVTRSLFGSTDAADVPDPITMQLVKLFSTDIDFHDDIRKGARFAVVYEQLYDGADPVKSGRLLAAEFVNGDTSYRAVYFEMEYGIGDYYTPEGNNLRKAFLRSPVEFSRVSSGFTLSRLHPIFNTWRAHKGVDFAAPSGAPIIATADGTVSFIGRQGGYGNVVELRHHQQYSTLYGHLSRFATGISKGDKVRQGQIIGYVGATGWATGPHLHYEFRINGVHQNPLGVTLPQAFPVAPRYRARFEELSRPLVANLDIAADSAKVAARFQ